MIAESDTIKSVAARWRVTLRPGAKLDAAALIARVRDRKGPHQAPKAVHVVPELPKTVAAKIDKKALRAARSPV